MYADFWYLVVAAAIQKDRTWLDISSDASDTSSAILLWVVIAFVKLLALRFSQNMFVVSYPDQGRKGTSEYAGIPIPAR